MKLSLLFGLLFVLKVGCKFVFLQVEIRIKKKDL